MEESEEPPLGNLVWLKTTDTTETKCRQCVWMEYPNLPVLKGLLTKTWYYYEEDNGSLEQPSAELNSNKGLPGDFKQGWHHTAKQFRLVSSCHLRGYVPPDSAPEASWTLPRLSITAATQQWAGSMEAVCRDPTLQCRDTSRGTSSLGGMSAACQEQQGCTQSWNNVSPAGGVCT